MLRAGGLQATKEDIFKADVAGWCVEWVSAPPYFAYFCFLGVFWFLP
jgi:hypothetical protein